MKYETEQKIEAHVAAFVAALNGRFREHCSDAMLVGLLMHRLCREYYKTGRSHGPTSRARALLSGDPNAAYDAAQPIFETVLERHCRAGGNGHHVAQNFGAHMEKLEIAEPSDT